MSMKICLMHNTSSNLVQPIQQNLTKNPFNVIHQLEVESGKAIGRSQTNPKSSSRVQFSKWASQSLN